MQKIQSLGKKHLHIFISHAIFWCFCFQAAIAIRGIIINNWNSWLGCVHIKSVNWAVIKWFIRWRNELAWMQLTIIVWQMNGWTNWTITIAFWRRNCIFTMEGIRIVTSLRTSLLNLQIDIWMKIRNLNSSNTFANLYKEHTFRGISWGEKLVESSSEQGDSSLDRLIPVEQFRQLAICNWWFTSVTLLAHSNEIWLLLRVVGETKASLKLCPFTLVGPKGVCRSHCHLISCLVWYPSNSSSCTLSGMTHTLTPFSCIIRVKWKMSRHHEK